jgi:hypothetical protein
MTKATLAIGACLLLACSLSHGADPYDGDWSVTYVGQTGAALDAGLSLSGASGSWITHLGYRPSYNYPCFGHEFPVTARQSPTELILTVSGSKVIAGCFDFTVTLKPVDEKTLEGHFSNGHPIKLKRP